MYTVIVILIVIAALLMCGIVFIQESKGGGLASGFADNNSLLGVRKTTDFIEKATWTLAAVMVVLSVVSVFVLPETTAGEKTVMTQTGQAATSAAQQGIPQSAAQQGAQTAQPAAGQAQSAAATPGAEGAQPAAATAQPAAETAQPAAASAQPAAATPDATPAQPAK